MNEKLEDENIFFRFCKIRIHRKLWIFPFFLRWFVDFEVSRLFDSMAWFKKYTKHLWLKNSHFEINLNWDESLFCLEWFYKFAEKFSVLSVGKMAEVKA